MAFIRKVRGFTPRMGKDCFLADTAAVVGDVIMGDRCTIWYGTVLRGDVNAIRIGNNVNVQDCAVLHTLYQKSTIEIGDNVSIGHNAIIHGAKICDDALIGMGAIVMDHAVIGQGAIIAAGAVVLSKTIVPPYTMWAGAPAKQIKEVNPEQSLELNQKIANNYHTYASWFMDEESTLIEDDF